MDTSYQVLADLVLLGHVVLVAFVVGGLMLVVAGNLRGWRWINAFWFRLAHLAAIAVVAAQAWLGATCPLTSLEMWLRAQAHLTTYSGSFIEHWLQTLLYYDAPAWVFVLAYSGFGLLVGAAWWYFPPERRQRPCRLTFGRTPMPLQRTQTLLLASTVLITLLVLSGVRPFDRTTWALEVFPVVVALPFLWATYHRFPLTTLLYTLIVTIQEPAAA